MADLVPTFIHVEGYINAPTTLSNDLGLLLAYTTAMIMRNIGSNGSSFVSKIEGHVLGVGTLTTHGQP